MNYKGLGYIKVFDLKRFTPEVHSEYQNSNTLNTTVSESDIQSYNCESNKLVNSTENDIVHTVVKGEVKETFEKTSEEVKPFNISGIQSKAIFRTCKHTAEELAKLTEHSDPTLVKLGDTFGSREAFKQYLNDKAKSWFYYYVCRNSKKKIIEYNCICMAYNLKPREIVIRKQKKRTTACPCKIRLTCDQSTNKVIVYYVCNHHDHALTEAAFHQYPHAKYLPPNVKDEFLDLAYLGLDVDLIQKHIHSLVGVTIKRKDIWSYAYKFKRNILQRNLSADRKDYMKNLILSIQETFYRVGNKTGGENQTENAKNGQERVQDRVKTQGPLKKIQKHTSKEDIHKFNNESEDSLFGEVLAASIDKSEVDVIVQYIDEKGILCDANGIPITNSSAIMKFINNHEYIFPDNIAECSEAVLSELAESVDEISPIEWESAHGVNPFESTSVSQYVDTEVVVSDDIISQELTVDCEDNFENQAVDSIDQNQAVEVPQSPGLYAEMDNFKKYYFVDHGYIKYEGDNEGDDEKVVESFRGETMYAVSVLSAGYIKAPIQLCPAPIRYCNGHENMTILTDPDAIWAGAKFLGHEVFKSYINERASRWFFYYSLVESGKLPEYYVYKCVYGKNRVSRNAYRAKGLRKRSKLTTHCPCQLRLRRLDSAPQYLTVLYSCNHHDHPLDDGQFTAQPHSRRLPSRVKEEIKDMLSLGVSFDVLRKYLTAETGHRIYSKYFHNVKMKMKRCEEVREFTSHQLMRLTLKIKDLQSKYGTTPKANRPARRTRKAKKKPSQVTPEDRNPPGGSNEAATQLPEYMEMDLTDEVAEEVCITEEESFSPPALMQSRLEAELQNLSSREDTLLKVRKLQESVRCDALKQSSHPYNRHNSVR